MDLLSSTDQKLLTHTLLVELLAHQFAFPVQWIQTQKSLFETSPAIRRIVEFGPSKILANIAKRSHARKYNRSDCVNLIQREFLASTRDIKELRFEYEHQKDQEEHEDETPVQSAPSPTPVLLAVEPVKPAQVEQVAASTVADVPTTTLEIIRAIIASKVRKSLDIVAESCSIKELCGGKSTLQNEIIGDLTVEFGSVADGSEDLSLAALAKSTESQFNGQLGKISAALVARFISSLMPAKFGLKSARDHISARWLLGPSRQTSVLVLAAAVASASATSRFANAESAKKFIDDIVQSYAAANALTLPSRQTSSQDLATAASVVDQAALKSLSATNNQLLRQQLDVLAKHLTLEVIEQGVVLEKDRAAADLQQALDKIVGELGDDFIGGIQPRFLAEQARHFDFAWNQTREDQVRLHYSRVIENQAVRTISETSRSIFTINGSLYPPPICSVPTLSTGASTPCSDNSSDTCVDFPRLSVSLNAGRPRTTVQRDGTIEVEIRDRTEDQHGLTYASLIRQGLQHNGTKVSSQVQLLMKEECCWKASNTAAHKFFEIIDMMQDEGISVAGMTVLVTGAGKQSIAEEVVRLLLMGGASVIIASSRGPAESSEHYRQLYAKSCGLESSLTVLPFNQASASDCKNLIDHIYHTDGLNRDLDVLLPFAAISETGVEIDGLDGKSELAHRLMLTNVFRLIGGIIQNKRAKGIQNKLTKIILPLSPNHGIFGGDGLYSASKLGLESVLSRAVSESWSDVVSVCGAIIGWTRGTGLMQQNDIVAERIEENGVLTFSSTEMAANLVALLHSQVTDCFEDEPLLADFSGGLGGLSNLKKVFDKAREDVLLESSIAKAIYEEDQLEGTGQLTQPSQHDAVPRSLTTLELDFPPLPDFDNDLAPLGHLRDMVDLSGVVVVVGYSELGPWGSARTRWAMESQHELSQAACIELAWMTNMIKHFDGNDTKGLYVGWVDAQSGERVADYEIPEMYRQRLLECCGVRIVKPSKDRPYDPENKESLQEVVLDAELPEFETDAESAAAFARRHGENVIIRPNNDSDQKLVRFKAGSRILVPKASRLDRALCAAQLPSGWDPRVYGINEDIINQVDPVTLYALCCVAEAFLSSGIVDPMEIYQYIHTSEIGNIIGSSMGGTEKTRNMYRDIYLNKYVQGDVIQETYLNTPAAWVNMLLLGANGPIKTPVGACATGIEAIDIGFESIISGKTKMCIVGGTDNFHEDESFGFSTMKATVDTAKELASGRLPSEMSRPSAESRAGFVESQGCGIQLLCNAELAIEMGLPIYAIVAGSTMAADKISRSVPAPGQGVLTFARESAEARHSPLLNISYRKLCMEAELARLCKPPVTSQPSIPGVLTPPVPQDYENGEFGIQQLPGDSFEYSISPTKLNSIKRYWGNDFRNQDTSISPMRAALAVWGLGVDDISVVSLHGTSTKANDKNESNVVNTQMQHLGRGNIPLLAICQKSVTGHPKAPAASWMLNGCLQAMATNVVPGNRNADNVDPALKQFEHIVYPTTAIKVDKIDGFLLNSFGFGQKGGQMVGVHARFVLATLKRTQYETYCRKRERRIQLANQEFARSLFTNKIVKIVDKPQYNSDEEDIIFLDPAARLSDTMAFPKSRVPKSQPCLRPEESGVTSEFRDTTKTIGDQDRKVNEIMQGIKTSVDSTLQQQATDVTRRTAIGIDAENLQAFTYDENPVFIGRNYTEQEQEVARSAVDSHASYVGRWCAKEAVFKSLGMPSYGAGAPLKDIEVVSGPGGKPHVKLHNDAAVHAAELGITDIELSITYTDTHVFAIALASKGSASKDQSDKS